VENVLIAKTAKKVTTQRDAKSAELKTVFLAKMTGVKFAGRKRGKRRFWIFDKF